MKYELSHAFRGLQDMENYRIKDVLICSVGNNCSLHEISRTENATFPEAKELLSKLNKWEDYIVATYLLTVGIVSSILNGLVVYVCVRKMRSLVSCDFFILNLAVVDIFMPVVGFPLTIYSSFMHKWIIGDFRKYYFVCAAYGFIGFFCGVVSIATLAAISYARYIKVCGVKHADKILTHTNTCIIGIYAYAAFWACLPIFGIGGYGPEPYGTSCTLEWEGHQVFVTFFLIMCVILPVVVMNVSYGRILFHTKNASRRTKRTITQRGTTVKKRELYLIKITLTMCVGFVGLWSPYAVVSLWTAYGRKGEVPIRITLMSVLLAKLSTIVNPLVYFMLNKKFRPIVRKYITGISIKIQRGFALLA